MNITAQLFRIFNTVKANAFEWDKRLELTAEEMESKKDLTYPSSYYYAAYYGGAYDAAKIMLKTYRGEFTDTEVEQWVKTLDCPENEGKPN